MHVLTLSNIHQSMEPVKVGMKHFKQQSKFILLAITILYNTATCAQTLSYIQAEQYILHNSYSTQASQALQQASQLEATALKGLGLPRVDLNVRAYSYHQELEVPLGGIKNNLEQTLRNNVQWLGGNSNTAVIKDEIGQSIQDGVGLIPNAYQLNLDNQVVQPTISMMIPLYTGGLISSTKEMAQINADRQQLNDQQQQDLQRFELIQVYFNSQLQHQLLAASQYNLKALQGHYQNALKLEQQGFISKGQRMQFEVAKNNAERGLQNSEANYRSSLFQLNNLLQSSQIKDLSTPLFVNKTPSTSLNALLKSYPEQSVLIRKMQKDIQLANAQVKIKSAATKPNVFAFGEYGLEDNPHWIVGVAARYNLFSGVDHKKNIQAAELQRYATELMTARSKQEIETLIYKSYSEMLTAQQSDFLLQQNLKAAVENLRIQELSFKEDMATANQVIDAQNMLSGLKAEMALNAYKYLMSLATLLHSHGSIDQFSEYLTQPNTHYINS